MAFATVSLAVDAPWSRQFLGGPLLCCRSFQVHPPLRTQGSVFFQDIWCEALWPAPAKWGVQQNQVVIRCPVPEKMKRIPVYQGISVQAAVLEIAQKPLAVPGILLDKMHHAGAAGPGFKAKGTAASKKVKNICVRKMGAKPAEKTLAHDAGCRADAAVPGGPEMASPAAPGNDPDAHGFPSPRSCRLFLVALREIMGKVMSGGWPETMVLEWLKRNKSPAAGESPESAGEGDGAVSAFPADPPEARKGFLSRLREGLGRSREQLVSGMERILLGRKAIDGELLEDLEALLLQADMGMEATRQIMDQVIRQVERRELTDPVALKSAIREALLGILRPHVQEWVPTKGQTQVLMLVGINGAGKTTTIGKLAARWKSEGFSVLLGAGDTFRAAAVEQLQGWGQRVQVPVIAQGSGADSASVLFDAFSAARARSIDVLIADTAGRLHTQGHLMEELRKVKRVLAKQDPSAPQEIWLVLDAGTGQNALRQVQQFHEAVGLTGICITKLDGTAKGGMVAAIASTLPIPIRFVGVGEGVDDLRPFDAEAFVDALFSGSIA